MDDKLTDGEINHSQKILKSQFPQLNGLRLTLCQEMPSNESIQNWLQIFHCRLVAVSSKNHCLSAP